MPQPDERAQGSERAKILLVDDNEEDIELTLYALAGGHAGVGVRVARDGEEALEFLDHCAESGEVPEVVLLDLKLPKLDGLQVLRHMRSNPVTELIPVVVLTSSLQRDDVLTSYRLGANSYIAKPVNFEQYRGIVNQLVLYWLEVNQSPLVDG